MQLANRGMVPSSWQQLSAGGPMLMADDTLTWGVWVLLSGV